MPRRVPEPWPRRLATARTGIVGLSPDGVDRRVYRRLRTGWFVFRSVAGPGRHASASALERLRAEFQDIRVRLRESPHQLVVLTELAVRSLRDPKIARILQYLDQGWRGHLISIFDAGVKDKSFRADLNVESAATALMTQLRGLGFQGILDADKIDQLVSTMSVQTEEWIRAQRRTHKKRSEN